MAGAPPRDDAAPEAELSLYGDELEPGALVGPWVVEARVHPGVTAWLYRASHLSTRAPAALKVVREQFNHVSEVLRRFKQEADTLQALRHPHIVEVLEYGELRDGRPWLAMEWLEGESVDQWLAHRGPFSAAEALTVMEELGGALHFAHGRGVLHRDLKAQNVMVLPRAEGFTVKLVDFGIARVQAPEGLSGLTSAGAVLGTPVAMAPEQIRGQTVDARTDLYALGVLLYQLLTGRLPFEGTSAVEVEEQHLHAPPPRLGERVQAPPVLEAVVQRCLAKRPEDRWPDVPAFLEALRAALAPFSSPPWAAGLYVDVRFPESHEELTDEDLDAKEAALDAARDALEAAGWMFAVDGGNVLLAWHALPEEAQARTQALDSARVLAEEVLTRACELAGSRAHVRVYAHTAPGEVTRDAQGRPRLASGDLLRLDLWTTGGAPGTVTWADAALPR
ncbi:serine/threonine-protein kinase [Pyxidicoccus sp. MSG2]|uniref:serine/threonine-protein kinase n=1 Tax=Pyxidicoccus sp. MSG2 TaxID=2996790 RepID=UPI002270BE05|nr:serine/threonine-protein kinase [Pyxidicoccus sp. MSG2]MCY1022263.1 serine/threonine-protein kinase [Pyxidicoccus sp. MSG2]